MSTFGRKYPVGTSLSVLFSHDKAKSLFTPWELG